MTNVKLCKLLDFDLLSKMCGCLGRYVLSSVNKMTCNKKKVRPKRSEEEKAKVVHVPSFPIEGDKVLNLQILNANLVKLIDGLRKEKDVLTTNVTEMQSEIGAARRKTEEWKEAEK